MNVLDLFSQNRSVVKLGLQWWNQRSSDMHKITIVQQIDQCKSTKTKKQRKFKHYNNYLHYRFYSFAALINFKGAEIRCSFEIKCYVCIVLVWFRAASRDYVSKWYKVCILVLILWLFIDDCCQSFSILSSKTSLIRESVKTNSIPFFSSQKLFPRWTFSLCSTAISKPTDQIGKL